MAEFADILVVNSYANHNQCVILQWTVVRRMRNVYTDNTNK